MTVTSMGSRPEAESATDDGDAHWVFDPVPPSGAIRGGIPVAYVFPQDLQIFVREILQNAHDQKRPDADTVSVSFDLISLTGSSQRRFLQALRWEDLRLHLDALAASEALNAGQMARAVGDIDEGADLLVLRIQDTGTAGLTGEEDANGSNYKALVRNILDTSEKGPQRGGSHGLGKAVLWSFSRLGTVLFSSTIVGNHGEEKFRFIGRTDLSHHVTDDGDWDGPGWYGARDPHRERAVSVWNGVAIEQAEPLLLDREGIGTGTSILVVGFNEPREEEFRSPEKMADDITRFAADNYWPALGKGTLDVKVRVMRDGQVAYQSDGPLSPEVEKFKKAGDTSGADERAPEAGDIAERILSITIPARMADGPDDVEVPEVSARFRLRLLRTTEDDSGEYVNTVALVRGAGMVIDYWSPGRKPLSGGGFRAVLEVGQALDGEPGFDPVANRALEEFLRASEPPAHNKWDPHTPRLKSQYRPGAVGRIRELWKDIGNAIVEMCEQKPPADADGPDRLKSLFPLGREGRPPRARFRVEYDYVNSRYRSEENTWDLAASVHRIGSDGQAPWVAIVSVNLEGDSGRGSRIDIGDVTLPPGSDARAECDGGRCVIHVPGNVDAAAFVVSAAVPGDVTITRRTRARLSATAHDEAVEV